jgi:hypothetical protein
VADPPAIPQHHGVDRAERARVGRHVVQQRQHRLLAGVRDVQSVEAHPLGRGQQLRQCVGAESEHLQVDQLVEIPQALGGRFGLVQGSGPRRLDAGADQADEAGGRGVRRHAGGVPRWILVIAHLGGAPSNLLINDGIFEQETDQSGKTGKNRLFRDEVALNAKWRIESFESVSVDDPR